jgi:hypothetical protein
MIIRRKHSGSFAVIPNTVSNDERLGAETLGVLAYLIAQPDLGHVSTEDIQARFKIGKARAEGMLKELESFGYDEREWEPI